MRQRTARLLEKNGLSTGKTGQDFERERERPALGLPAVIRYQHSTEEKLRANVPRDIEPILRSYFKFAPMPFHLDLLRTMFKGGKHVVNWPTDHAKSMTSSFWFPILSLMHNPNEAHIICGANYYDSSSRVGAIGAALSPGGYLAEGVSNENLLRDYPWIAKPNSRSVKWSARELNVVGRTASSRNPSVYATTISAQDIRGRRGKLVLDDVEGMKHRHSPMERQKLYEKIQLEGNRCYEDANESDRPLLIALGTPFDVDSVYFRLESLGWEVHRQAYKYWVCNDIRGCCEGDPERAKANDHGRLIWPAKHEKIEELRKGLTKQEFSIAFRMDPKGGDDSILSYQEIARLADTEMEFSSKDLVCKSCSGSGSIFRMQNGSYVWARCPECNGQQRSVEPVVLVCLDPASGSKQRWADYAGLAVIRIVWVVGEQLPKVEILEAHKISGGVFEQVKYAAQLASTYQCEIVFESNSQQGNNYEDVFKHLEHSGEIPKVGRNRFYTTAQRKWQSNLDVTILKTMLRSQRLLVPASRQELEGVQTLFNEIRDLGSNTHDHIAMSIWIGIRWAYENLRMGRAQTMTQNPFAPSMARSHFQGRRFGWGR